MQTETQLLDQIKRMTKPGDSFTVDTVTERDNVYSQLRTLRNLKQQPAVTIKSTKQDGIGWKFYAI